MNPRHLRPAFRFEDRHVVVQDDLLHLPRYYDNHDKIIEFDRPLCVEFCSGNGHWIVERALARPDCQWVAVEMQFSRVAKIWSKRANQNLKNLFIVCGEAQTFIRHYLESSSVREVYINFPDPWPKTRHAKHRLIQPPFLEQLARVLEPEGLFTFVTDDAPYAAQLEAMIPSSFSLSEHSDDLASYGESTFYSLWRRLNRSFQALTYQLTGDGVVEEAAAVCQSQPVACALE